MSSQHRCKARHNAALLGQCRRRRKLEALVPGLACVMFLFLSAPSGAQTVADFYRGKTINFIIGYPAAGAPDVYARLVTRHLARYIPGGPTIIARNMAGAGSLLAANHLFNNAVRDGTILGMTSPTIPLEETLGSPQSKYNASQFNWIGRLATNPNITFINATSHVKTINDAFEKIAILGATGRSSTNAVYPTVLNNVLGTKFKIVTGYQGTADVMLAMERGEVEGNSATLDGLTAQHPDWIATKRINIVVQYLLRRHPDLPDVPTMAELARTPEQASVLRTVSSASEIGKFVLTTPGVPAQRVAALRAAFDAVVKDPEFVAEAHKLGVEIDSLSGAELQKVVHETQSIAPDVIEKVKAIYPLN
jgi:tripartite-type tricarboxylate transporter receptor subunit TctC